MSCARCEGTRETYWLGLPGLGGRKGPCPKCRKNAASDFSKVIFHEFWPPGLTWATDKPRAQGAR